MGYLTTLQQPVVENTAPPPKKKQKKKNKTKQKGRVPLIGLAKSIYYRIRETHFGKVM